MAFGGLVFVQAVQATAPVWPDQVRITAPEFSVDYERKAYLYSGGAVLTYGPSTVTADRLEVVETPEGRVGRAEGSVVITDPDGTLSAKDLLMRWDREGVLQQADATAVFINLDGSLVKADSATLTPLLWTFRKVSVTNCRQRPPFFAVESEVLTVVPGQYGRAGGAKVRLLGLPIPSPVPIRFNLDPRVVGIRPPGFGYREDDGFGVSWVSGVTLSQNTVANATIDSYPRVRPGYSLEVTRTFERNDLSRNLVNPQNDLRERFEWSYFESVRNLDFGRESRFLADRRKSVTLLTNWNSRTEARQVNEILTKAVEGVYEESGVRSGVSVLSQLRMQVVRRDSEPFLTRAVASSSAVLPSKKVLPQVSSLVRFDGSLTSRSGYGWLRATTGLVYQPKPYLQFGAAVYGGIEGTDPDFVSDRLLSSNGAALRFDYSLGPRRVTYMWKYDDRLKWYTTEYAITQAVGCLDFYVVSRRVPQDYRIGFRFRFDNLLNLFQRRKINRGSNQQSLFGPKPTGPR